MTEYFKNTNIKVRKSKKEIEKLRLSYFLNELSEQTKSEFIDGEIVIQSPARKKHINLSTSLTILLKLHIEKNKLGWLASEKALVSMQNENNHYEPDICFFKKEKSDNFNADTCQFPPPDLAVEILSKSSVNRDKKKKFKDYANNDVEEYWIIDTDKMEIEQYYLQKRGLYVLANKYRLNDTIKSIAVKDFEVPVVSMFFYDDLNEFLFGKYEKNINDFTDKIKIKDQQLEQKDQQLEQKDQQLEKKNQLIAEQSELIKKLQEQLKR